MSVQPAGRAARCTGAGAVVRALEAEGCAVVFGIPGGAIMPLYDALLDSAVVRHVLVRHEQGAGHAAVGYAQATGEVGVCCATSGPGAANLVTPLADAYLDSVPVVAVTGQVPRSAMGTDAFQEADICGMTEPVTKHNVLVTDPADIPRVIAEAVHIAATGRPGPVLVDIPKDVQQAETTFRWPPHRRLPGYRVTSRPARKQVAEAARAVRAARRPVLYVGGGVIKADAAGELRQLAELSGIPVVTTVMARGAFPDSHELHLGLPGSGAASAALRRADVLVVLGARLDADAAGQLAPDATVVHADIDPAEISRHRHADVPIVGDCEEILSRLVAALRESGTVADLAPWRAELAAQRDSSGDERPADGLSPRYVVERIGALVGPDAVYVAGAGRPRMWAARAIGCERPRSWINSGGLGTPGFAVPAAMGAKFGLPDTPVWAIAEDGCFQMTNQELATCALEGAPIKVAVINGGERGVPDFALLAEALGCAGLRCAGLRCAARDDVDDAIQRAMAIDDRPVVIDFVV